MKNLDIKIIWRDGDAADEKAYAKSEVDKMIRKGSHGVIQRFVITLTWEQWVNLIVLTSLVIELFWGREWLVGACTLIVNLAFFFYYQRLKNNLKKESIDTNVLEYLYRVEKIVRQFMRHLKIASLLILVLAIWAAYYLNTQSFFHETMDPWPFWGGTIGGMAVALPLSFYLIHLMYGKKARKLRRMIESLEQEETE